MHYPQSYTNVLIAGKVYIIVKYHCKNEGSPELHFKTGVKVLPQGTLQMWE